MTNNFITPMNRHMTDFFHLSYDIRPVHFDRPESVIIYGQLEGLPYPYRYKNQFVQHRKPANSNTQNT